MIEFVTKIYEGICSKVDYNLTDEERDHIIQFAVDREGKWLENLKTGRSSETSKYAYFYQIVKGKCVNIWYKKQKDENTK